MKFPESGLVSAINNFFNNFLLSFLHSSDLIEALENYNITQIACGFQHSVAVSEFGSIYVWGSNNFNQCGLENDAGSEYFDTPKLVKTLGTAQVVQVACGQFHTLALTNAGELYSFGANCHGQLGLGFESEKVTKPTLIKSLQGIPIAQLACGANHSFILSKSGSIYGFGKNIFGQLGVGDSNSKCYPTHVKTLRNQCVRYISCGEDFSVFLTMDGGVFTTGLGAFGQLGHGTYRNEILPRQIFELMGSTVTQIACGRRHTLTLLPSRRKIYGFGLGGCGQLGTGKDFNKSSLPQICTGPWVHDDHEDHKLIIRQIYAGGDHCCVQLGDLETEDFRVPAKSKQIWTLTRELMETCAKCESMVPVDLDIMNAVEVIFKNSACFNGSFLHDRNLSCNSKNHGVDLLEAETAFESVRKIENESLKSLIWESITCDLIVSLSKNPPDIETLRIYLILPLYHEFVNSKNYSKIHTPFCTILMSLEEIPRRIITTWYSHTTIEYFERLIDIFKDVIKYFLQCEISKVQGVEKQLKFESHFYTALNMLSLLYHINHQERKEKVPYDIFHINEITNYFDIRNDYVAWSQDTKPNSFYLCNYPFIFDANAKHLLLQTDQALQMHFAMKNAATQSFFSLFGPPPNVHIVLTVSRENIVEDTIRELQKYTSGDLKKPLRVKFIGEEAEDTGGVRKEFFMLLLKDVLDTKYGMFQFYEESRCIWFSENPFEEDVSMYHLVGILCGLAIYNFNIINLTFPLALYKKLLNETPDLSDLKELTPIVWKSMQSLMDYQESDFSDVFCLTFEITRNIFGENKSIELKPNGANIPVTLDNK
jgi:E3 ubiquitin-protein ligase HERC4